MHCWPQGLRAFEYLVKFGPGQQRKYLNNEFIGVSSVSIVSLLAFTLDFIKKKIKRKYMKNKWRKFFREILLQLSVDFHTNVADLIQQELAPEAYFLDKRRCPFTLGEAYECKRKRNKRSS